MSKNRGQIKADIQANLTDLNLNFFSDNDLNTSIQDAYIDVSIITQCIQKKVNLDWIGGLSYYDFTIAPFNLDDYLNIIAIFNKQTNLWLADNLSLKDFDRLRRDWEKWIGQVRYWAPSDFKRIAIAAKLSASTVGHSGFTLYYAAVAPSLDSDSDTFLIANDMTEIITWYAIADLLEQAQEFIKAGDYWALYDEHTVSYADRVKRITKSDLLLRI